MKSTQQNSFLADLKSWQASVNKSTQEYVSLVDREEGDEASLAAAQEAIVSKAMSFAEMTNPSLTISSLVFAVNTEPNCARASLINKIQPSLHAVVRIALDLDIFEIVSGPTTVTQVAEKTGADPQLICESCFQLGRYLPTPLITRLTKCSPLHESLIGLWLPR